MEVANDDDAKGCWFDRFSLAVPSQPMMGEELNATEVTKGGLLGDRAYALVDSSTERLQAPRTRGSGRSSSTAAPRWLTPQEPA
jgi:uncharacterized protein YcbX